MPDRILRASILTSESVNALSWGAEVFYRRLMSIADDFGRYDGRPAILRAQLYPLILGRVSESDVGKWIGECQEAALVRFYTVEGKSYAEILKFGQRTRAQASKWPPPPASADKCPRVSADGGHPRPYTETESESESNIEVGDVRRLNDERLNASKGEAVTKNKAVSEGLSPKRVNRSSLKRPAGGNGQAEKALLAKLRAVVGDDEMARAGGHWTVDHVRKHPRLLESAIAEVAGMVKEGRGPENPAAYLEDLVKRWRE